MVKHAWEISSNEDGMEKNTKPTGSGDVSQLRKKSTADSSKILDCTANHEMWSRRSRHCGESQGVYVCTRLEGAVLQPETVYLSVEQRGFSSWACPKSMDYDAKGV